MVVTLPSLQGYTIEDFGYQLGRHWGIGTAKLDNGVLLIVAPNERKVRIEVGCGLEPILTDALSKIIIENAILPRFRAGDFAGGIKDGVRDIALVLTGDAAEVEERAKARHDADEPAIDWFTVLFWAHHLAVGPSTVLYTPAPFATWAAVRRRRWPRLERGLGRRRLEAAAAVSPVAAAVSAAAAPPGLVAIAPCSPSPRGT